MALDILSCLVLSLYACLVLLQFDTRDPSPCTSTPGSMRFLCSGLRAFCSDLLAIRRFCPIHVFRTRRGSLTHSLPHLLTPSLPFVLTPARLHPPPRTDPRFQDKKALSADGWGRNQEWDIDAGNNDKCGTYITELDAKALGGDVFLGVKCDGGGSLEYVFAQ